MYIQSTTFGYGGDLRVHVSDDRTDIVLSADASLSMKHEDARRLCEMIAEEHKRAGVEVRA